MKLISKFSRRSCVRVTVTSFARLAQTLLLACLASLFATGLARAAFVNNGNGTITDTDTGLIWDRCLLGRSGVNCEVGGSLLRNWERALQEVSARNAANYLGFNDWRMPNIKELQSLVLIDRPLPTPFDTTAFPNFDTSSWSSTTAALTYSSRGLGAYSIGSTNAVLVNTLKTSTAAIRLVRGGGGSASFDTLACDLDYNGDGVVNSTDALLLMRWLVGFRGLGLVAGVTTVPSGTAPGVFADAVAARMSFTSIQDFDSDANMMALTDGLLLLRLTQGVSDAALVQGTLGANAQRALGADIRLHVNTRCRTNFQPLP